MAQPTARLARRRRPLELVLARNRRAAVFVTAMVAYPAGLRFSLHSFVRPGEVLPDGFGALLFWNRWRTGRGRFDPPPQLLRYGVQFSDGRKASGVAESLGELGHAVTTFAFEGKDAPNPVHDVLLTPSGLEGSERHSVQECWLWPLPPAGPLAFICEWPAFDIPERRVEIDAEIIHGAASRAQALWADRS